MDRETFGGLLGGGIDAYLKVKYGASPPCTTKWVSTKGPHGNMSVEWNEELWIPLMLPTMTKKIECSLWDFDRGMPDDRVGTFYLNLRTLQQRPLQPRWIPVYGPPEEASMGKNKKRMTCLPGTGTNYRGRVLLAARIEHNAIDEPEMVHKKGSPGITASLMPHEVSLTLKALILLGSEIPAFSKNILMSTGLKSTKVGVMVTCGPYSVRTKRVNPVEGEAKFSADLSMDIKIPLESEQQPDTYVYLFQGEEGKDFRRVCYAKLNTTQLLAQGFSAPAYWQPLKEDLAINALGDKELPGAVLLRIGIGNASEVPADWQDDLRVLGRSKPYDLRVHVFQARGLPSADDDSGVDPYVRVSCAGAVIESTRKFRTHDPLFYETLNLSVVLPELRFAPQVSIQLWDHDKFTSDDYLSETRLSLDSPDVLCVNFDTEPLPQQLPDPKWYKLYRYADTSQSCGEVLLLVQLVEKSAPSVFVPIVPASIAPATVPAFIDIIALGVRNLRPVDFMPVYMPLTEFDLGDQSKSTNIQRTKYSKRPSGANANFQQRLTFPVDLPVNPLFAPSLNATVRDQRLGGLLTPVVGLTTISLANKLPWSDSYVPPMGAELSDEVYKPETSLLDQQKAAQRSSEAAAAEQNESATGTNKESAETNLQPVSTDSSGDAAGQFELKATDSDSAHLTDSKREIDDAPIAVQPSPVVPSAVAARTALDRTASVSYVDSVWMHPEIVTRDGSQYANDEKSAAYMKNRAIFDCSLEKALMTAPFESYTLYTGQTVGRGSVLGMKMKSTLKEAGSFKGIVRVITDADEPPPIDMSLLLKPKLYVVRVYVLRGMGLQPHDDNGTSDPYLRLTLGDTVIEDEEGRIMKTNDPEFFRAYELKTLLPGPSKLEIAVLDYDYLSFNDFIGKTVIDLEDRIFDPRWKGMGKEHHVDRVRFAPKPVERRPLWHAKSSVSQGTLECWVDILTTDEASVYPMVDIAKPPPTEYELRLIVWKTLGVKSMDYITSQNDLYVRSWLEGCDPQETDVHWRAKKGKASFNWRMKFDCKLPMKFPRLYLQLWDRDITKWNDCIAEAQMDLSSHLHKALHKGGRYNFFAKPPVMSKADKRRTALSAAATASDGDIKGQPPAKGTSAATAATPATAVASAIEHDGKDEEVGLTHLAAEDEEALLLPQNEAQKKGGLKKILLGNTQEDDEAAGEAAETMKNIKKIVGIEEDVEPDDAQWLSMYWTDFDSADKKSEFRGRVLVSLEAIPKTQATTALAAGYGRSEPNANPFLPPPVGRMKFSLNPFYVLNECLGPKVFRRCCFFLMCSGLITGLIFGAPFLNVVLEWLSFLPEPVGLILGIVLILFLIFPFCFIWWYTRDTSSPPDASDPNSRRTTSAQPTNRTSTSDEVHSMNNPLLQAQSKS